MKRLLLLLLCFAPAREAGPFEAVLGELRNLSPRPDRVADVDHLVLRRDAAEFQFVPLPLPVLTIGKEGDPNYEFLNIRTALRLPDGSFAITDQSPTIRVYDANGRFSKKLGREGEGPGEFRSVTRTLLVGDTMIAYDGMLRRLTRYSVDGVLLGTQRVQANVEDGTISIDGHLSNGRWLVETPPSANWNHGHGVYRDTTRIGTLPPSATGQVLWAGSFPGATFFAYMPGEDKSQWLVGWLYYAPTTIAHSIGDTIIVGDTSTPELRYFSSDGRLLRRMTLPLGAAPDLTQLRAAARDEALAQVKPGPTKSYYLASYNAERPAPRYRGFLVARDGRLWVKLFEESPSGPVRYLILDATGSIRARVSLPARSEVLTVQSPWILISQRDADDVERLAIVRWELP